MGRYITFDPQAIEDDVYNRLSEDTRHALADPQILKQILIICNRKAQQILEDDEVNMLNFQMFQYAMKLFQKEKKREMQKEEEERKRREPPPPPSKTQRAGIARLILINMIFFAVVAGGLMLVSGHSLFDFFGAGSFWAAKSRDDTDGSGF